MFLRAPRVGRKAAGAQSTPAEATQPSCGPRTMRFSDPASPSERRADEFAGSFVQTLRTMPVADVTEAASHSGAVVHRRVRRGVSRSDAGAAVDDRLDARIRRARTTGTPLEGAVQGRYERALGTTLGPVRVHADGESDQIARESQAEALTVGNDIFFARGRYRPDTVAGTELLAHEMAHVAQSAGGSSGLVHRKLAGHARLLVDNGHRHDPGGDATLLSWWKDIIAGLGRWEETEKTITEQSLQNNRKRYRAQLNELEQLARRWRATYARRDPKQAANPIDEQRDELLRVLIPRIGGEVWELDQPGYVASRPRNDASLISAEDDKVGGALNRLDLTTHQTERGPEQSFFIWDKPTRDANVGDTGAEANLRESDANQGGRSVASSRLDAILGGGVIVPVAFATHSSATGQRGGPAREKMGVLSGKAAGVAGADVKWARDRSEVSARGVAGDADVVEFSDPKLQRDLNVLQILDYVALQIDRHWRNFYVHAVGGTVQSVTGIDLDLSFGDFAAYAKSKDDARERDDLLAEHISPTGESLPYHKFTGMPRFFDAEFANRIAGISSSRLADGLTGLIQPEEVAAAVERFEQVKRAIEDARKEDQKAGRKPGDPRSRLITRWDQSTADRQLEGQSLGHEDNYLAKLQGEYRFREEFGQATSRVIEPLTDVLRFKAGWSNVDGKNLTQWWTATSAPLEQSIQSGRIPMTMAVEAVGEFVQRALHTPDIAADIARAVELNQGSDDASDQQAIYADQMYRPIVLSRLKGKLEQLWRSIIAELPARAAAAATAQRAADLLAIRAAAAAGSGAPPADSSRGRPRGRRF